MTNDELLERIAGTLKQEVGPAIEVEYPKTQAFMAAVVLQKIARELALKPQHNAAELVEREALVADLGAMLGLEKTSQALQSAYLNLQSSPGNSALCAFIEALYAAREMLGESVFEKTLTCVRTAMRASIDRQMEYAA